MLASLNHPNIAQIYGLEGSGDSRALVMELVAGSTLAVPLPLETALDYATQIAGALEVAHEKGITHRDLKPGNIMVTPEGVVKVLDFGLASVPGRETESDPANSPTMTMAVTRAGVILGTAAYMSPEQAAGKPVDKRSDIWSFGVVLWEMLTGARLFGGETVSHTLADVLRAPIDTAKLPPATPGPVVELVKRCLDRNVKTRLRDIGEARIAIQTWLANPAPANERQPVRSVRRPWLSWSSAALFFVLAVALGWVHFREVSPPARAINATLLPPEDTEFNFSPPYALPAISPDSTRIVYGAKGKDGKTQLWLRRLDSSAAQPLPGTQDASTPFWSPDSRWVAFGQDARLKKIDTQGGPPVLITDVGFAVRGGSWNSQGVIVFALNSANPIRRVSASGGPAVPVTKIEQVGHRHPWFLPDGRHFLYITQQAGDIPVLVGSLDEPEKPGKVVAQANSPAVYAQGYLLYMRDHTLMAQPFNADRLETGGEAIPLAEGVPVFSGISRIAAIGVSTGGLLVYASGGASQQARLLWKDRQGKALGALGEPQAGFMESVSLSPDGKRAAVTILNPLADIWVYDTARGIPARLTFDPKADYCPVWSPDGNLLYFQSNRNGPFDLYRKAANGDGTEVPLLVDSSDKYLSSVSPDGKLLLYSRSSTTGRGLWLLPLAPTGGGAKAEPRPLLQTATRGNFSPDGAWVVFESDESGQREVYVAPFSSPTSKRQVSLSGGHGPRWRKDGRELYYLSSSGQIIAAEVAARNGTLEVGRVQKLFDGSLTGGYGLPYDVTADGQKFLVVDTGAPAAPLLTLVQNWTATLRK